MNSWQLDLQYMPAIAAVALWLLLGTVVVLLGCHSMRGLDPIRKWAAIGLRLDLFLFCVLLLAGAQAKQRVADVAVIAVRDTSASAGNIRVITADVAGEKRGSPRPALAAREFLRRHLDQRPPMDRVGMVSFDGNASVDSLGGTTFGESGAVRMPVPGTDVAAGLQLGLATIPADAAGRLLLFWDGNANSGNLEDAIGAAVSQGVPIDVVPLRYRIDHEISLKRLIAPAARREGHTYSLDVIIRSQNVSETSVTLSVQDNGVAVDLDPAMSGSQPTRRVQLRPGTNAVHVRLPPAADGAHQYRAVIETSLGENDTLTANNIADAVTLVRGKSRILYVDRTVGSRQPLVEALRGGGQNVVIEGRDVSFPASIAELMAYDAVVLINVPRGVGGLDASQDLMLAQYVRDLGGGLIVVGGPNAMGAGGWIGSEVERVLPVDLQPPATVVMPTGALVLAIDQSGSMAAAMPGSSLTKQYTANESALLAVKTLIRRDRIGVLAFDSSPQWIVPMRKNDDVVGTERAVRAIEPGGETNIYSALVEAYDALHGLDQTEPVRVRHILLLTDGKSADGDFPGIVAKMRSAKISLSTIGIGGDVDRAFLAKLAADGGGNFYDVDDPKRLMQVFIKEAQTIRRSLIREGVISPSETGVESSILAGLHNDHWPAFSGMVTSWSKAAPTVVTPLVSEAGEPLLAHWSVGLGRATVFASDVGDRWASSLAASTVYDKFWTQLVRWTARASDSSSAEARIEASGPGRAKLIVENFDTSARPSFAPTAASILAPGKPRATTATLVQTGPGIYEAEFSTDQDGAYVAVVQTTSANGARAGLLPAAYVADSSAEFRDLSSNDTAVESVAKRTGGRVLDLADAATDLFTRENITTKYATQPLVGWLIAAALGTMLLDVSVRRIAWDRRSFTALLFPAASAIVPTPEAREVQFATLVATKERAAESIERKAKPPTRSTSVTSDRLATLLEAKRKAEERFEN